MKVVDALRGVGQRNNGAGGFHGSGLKRRAWVRAIVDRDAFYALIGLAGLLVAWELATRLFQINPILLPPFSSVVEAAIENAGSLAEHGIVTLSEIVAGLLLALVVGVLVGASFVFFVPLKRTFLPILIGLQSMPKIAVAPLLLVWLGYGFMPKVLLAFFVAVFPIVINTAIGMEGVDRDLIRLVKSMGANRRSIFWRVRLPAALPSIAGGAQIGVSLATIGAIVAEFIGSSQGLGYYLIISTNNFRTALVFAIILVLTGMAMILYQIVTFIAGLLMPWARTPRGME